MIPFHCSEWTTNVSSQFMREGLTFNSERSPWRQVEGDTGASTHPCQIFSLGIAVSLQLVVIYLEGKAGHCILIQ